MIKVLVIKSVLYCETKIVGKATVSINGIPQFPTDQDIERATKELEVWKEIKELLK